ncbi:MAG: tRNA (adenosine(37)-N6)-threonylcarbamoyltransferase complex ATPase subunit type 1 TsaE [Patescibacteria group bacterium]|nr:tRNA (adenosine(37)-N6)-threonylcarbamoyltransferase complex ATPase subunit type 1 TsaE [Patescibacteria group bacterium]
MKKEYITNSVLKTQKLAKQLAKEILKKQESRKAHVLGLEGDLGGGKTTFLQGFAKGLGIRQKILSPTFVILKKFKVKHKIFYHIDCYRIKKPKEILDLGFKQIISDPRNIVAVEWSNRIKKIMPKNTILISFEFINKNKRKIIIK